jgi:hypothetical protein
MISIIINAAHHRNAHQPPTTIKLQGFIRTAPHPKCILARRCEQPHTTTSCLSALFGGPLHFVRKQKEGRNRNVQSTLHSVVNTLSRRVPPTYSLLSHSLFLVPSKPHSSMHCTSWGLGVGRWAGEKRKRVKRSM